RIDFVFIRSDLETISKKQVVFLPWVAYNNYRTGGKYERQTRSTDDLGAIRRLLGANRAHLGGGLAAARRPWPAARRLAEVPQRHHLPYAYRLPVERAAGAVRR